LPWQALRRRALALVGRAEGADVVRRLAELVPGERVLSYTCDVGGATLVATHTALHLLEGHVEIRLACMHELVAVARERVAWTRQLTARIALPCGGAALVRVRRHPGTDQMLWFVYSARHLDIDDPAVRRELNDALAGLRASTGL
jgi:hypothetical protein